MTARCRSVRCLNSAHTRGLARHVLDGARDNERESPTIRNVSADRHHEGAKGGLQPSAERACYLCFLTILPNCQPLLGQSLLASCLTNFRKQSTIRAWLAEIERERETWAPRVLILILTPPHTFSMYVSAVSLRTYRSCCCRCRRDLELWFRSFWKNHSR